MTKERIKNELPPLPENSVLISNLKGYEDCLGYAIDRDANVWTCKASNFKPYCFTGKWRKLVLKTHGWGYPFFIMSNFGKDVTAKVHRLMGFSFIPNPNNYPVINHKNGIKSDNSLSNLEWCTQKQNAIHSIQNNHRNTAKGERLPNSKLKDADIPIIISLKKEGKSNVEIGRMFNIDPSNISRVYHGKRWKHVNPSLPLRRGGTSTQPSL